MIFYTFKDSKFLIYLCEEAMASLLVDHLDYANDGAPDADRHAEDGLGHVASLRAEQRNAATIGVTKTCRKTSRTGSKLNRDNT
jgi:hypothetical protein